MPPDARKAGEETGQMLGPDKILDDDEVERIAPQLGFPQPVEI